MQLSQAHGVSLDYRIGELPNLQFPPQHFDVIALIYAHFPSAIKSLYHQLLDRYLKVGGTIIFEAFSKSHVAYRKRDEKVGGPIDLDILFSTEELQMDFHNYNILELVEREVELREGNGHIGLGSVIRFVGQKR